jgi:hypothetical protein
MQALTKMVMVCAAALALSVSTASAAVVCNEDGDCWRVKGDVTYKPELKLQVYDDDWKWAEAEHTKYRWREPGPGTGYYRGGVWIGIDD